MRRQAILLSTLFTLLLAGCGPRQFVKGEYDQDINRTNLLTDKWSETDMQHAVKTLVESATKSYAVTSLKHPPVVMITHLQNKTSEHIDTQNIMDMVRVELMKSGRVTFIDKAAREDIAKEYAYENSGMVSNATKKSKGSQVGADFIINGRLDSIVQQAGSDKTVYYKLTLNMTNLKTGVIVWSDYKQIRKLYKKRRVGL